MPRHKWSPASGFTYIEALTVLVIAGVLMSIGAPLLNNMIQRSHLEGFARETSVLLQGARFNAIKKTNVQSVVRLDVAKGQLTSFADVDNDGVYDTTKGDFELARDTLPAGVAFGAPPADPGITTGLTADPAGTSGSPRIAILQSDGSIKDAGGFRLADRNGNFLEVRIAPQGTARVQVLKWDGTAWREQGYNGQPWVWK